MISIIKEPYQGLKRAYGAPRLHQVLKRLGYACSVRRVNRLMKEVGIKASTTGLYVWCPGKHKFYSSTGNQLAKEETSTQFGQQWVGDFSMFGVYQNRPS